MGVVNNRLLHAQHRGLSDVSDVVNSVDVGGLVSVSIQTGYDNVITAGADGNSMPEVDRLTQFVRGTVNTQDWTKPLEILAGTVGEYHWFERNSGAATFRRNEVKNPYIHTATINLAHRGRADCSFAFECWFDDSASDFADIWTTSDSISDSSVPNAILYEPGLEILSANHGTESDIYHCLAFSMTIAGQLSLASGDSDVGYTAVDIVWGGQPIAGTLTVQDADRFLTLLAAAKSDLILTVKQAQGAADKTLTIKDVIFTGLDSTSNAGPGYTGYTINWVQNSAQGTNYGYSANNPFLGDAAGVTIV